MNRGHCVVYVQDGKAFGDEYLAELDLIEVVEKYKEDYESDVEEPARSCAGSSSVSDDDMHAGKDSDRCALSAFESCLHAVFY